MSELDDLLGNAVEVRTSGGSRPALLQALAALLVCGLLIGALLSVIVGGVVVISSASAGTVTDCSTLASCTGLGGGTGAIG